MCHLTLHFTDSKPKIEFSNLFFSSYCSVYDLLIVKVSRRTTRNISPKWFITWWHLRSFLLLRDFANKENYAVVGTLLFCSVGWDVAVGSKQGQSSFIHKCNGITIWVVNYFLVRAPSSKWSKCLSNSFKRSGIKRSKN